MPPSAPFTPTLATIDLQSLAHNVTCVRRCLPKACDILAVVKANAYGHGAVEITRALLRLKVSRFAVATLEEGIELREAGIQAPLLIMGALFPEQIAGLIAHRLTPVIHRLEIATALAQQLKPGSEPYPVHVKIETGMGRLGLSPEDLMSLLSAAPFKGPLSIAGLMTHLADADSEDATYTEDQVGRFRSTLNEVEQAGLKVPFTHAANSAAILRYPSAHFSVARPGLMLYGYHTLPAQVEQPDLRPILTLTSTVAHILPVAKGKSISYNRTFTAMRPSRIAILPIGYADGYSRILSNRGAALIGGQRAPIVGRICMDMTMVDVTAIPDVLPGQRAVLIGRQGSASITANDLAEWSGTISYEVLCAIGPRIPRRYV